MNIEPKETVPEGPKRIVPDNCVCAHKWTSEHIDEIYPVCDEFVPWNGSNCANCAKCEHDKECHR